MSVERPVSGVGDREHLRTLAEQAQAGNCHGPWAVDNQAAYPQRVTNGGAVLLAECFENPDLPSLLVNYIAAVSPDVVLRLLDDLAAKDKLLIDALGYPEWVARAEKAEAALAAAREALRAAKIACWDTLNQLDEAGIDAPLLREAIGRLARAVLAVGGEHGDA